MSGEVDASRFGRSRRRPWTIDHRPVRLLAVGSGIVLVGASLSVLYHVTDVVGGTGPLLALVAGSLLLATVLSRFLPAPIGVALGAIMFIGGFATYLALIPDAYYELFTVDRVYADLVALVTGQSVIVLLAADLWAIAIAPGPTFLAWYLTLRRRYALAAAVGGVTLGFFALTGDAERTTTMLGTAGALGLIGFGSVEKHEGTGEQALDVGIVLALALFVARTIDVVPGGGGGPRTGSGEGPPLESSLLGTPEQVSIQGSISLSPEVRFSVSADRSAYWRVAAFDRYTGQGWVRTGRTRAYDDRLDDPPGASSWLFQQIEVRSTLDSIPAAWKPTLVGPSIADRTAVTEMDGLQPTEPFAPGERFTVGSLRPDWTPEDLSSAGTDYPDGIAARFLQLPESTPDRLEDRAREISADAANPYETARDLASWLEREKGYSLRVGRARWDAADTFVFHMEQGYCVHFATALAVMLRTMGIPSRFVVGYTPGERAEEGGEWTVRGLHSHAWVEVYFPDTGWVSVDPTPREPRETAERRRIEEATASGEVLDPGAAEQEILRNRSTATTRTPNGTAESATETTAETATATPDRGSLFPDGEATDAPSGTSPTTTAEEGAATPTGTEPGRRADRLSILFGLAGLVLGVHRLGVLQRAYRSFQMGTQDPTDSPAADVERAMERLEYLLSREHRPRRPNETVRGYVEVIEDEGLDERVHRVVALYERIHYAGRATREDAEEAVLLVDELFEES